MGTSLQPSTAADAFRRECTSRAVLDVLANKWVCLAVGALRPGTLRFSELRRRLDGITQKMLTQTLRRLERHGLVERTVHPTVPPRVEYRLTELGLGVAELMDAIRDWSEQHVHEIESATRRFDLRDAPEHRGTASD